jgi:hypothetical protein
LCRSVEKKVPELQFLKTSCGDREHITAKISRQDISMPKAMPSLKAMAQNAKAEKPRGPKKLEKRDPPPKTLSTEYVEDSGDESEATSDSDSGSKVASTSNGRPLAPDGSSSSSENDSDSEESSGVEESGAEEHDGEEEEEEEEEDETQAVQGKK